METTTFFSKLNATLATNRRNRKLAFGILLLVFLGMQVFLSPSLRGSDQFWYVGDVERVVLQDGLFKTNSIFPNSMPENASELPRSWVQNKPVSYLVLPLVYLTQNGHVAWMLFNMMCLFLAAFFTGKVLQIQKERLLYFIAVFVFFPFNFYLATQALPEIFILFLIAGIHYLLLVPPLNFKKNVLLAVITAVLICQRPNYILLLVLIPILFFIFHRKKAVVFSPSFVAIAIFSSFISLLFGEHLLKSPSIIDTIINNVHGVSNMGNFFDNYDHSNVSLNDLIALVWGKFGGAMKVQFGLSGLSAFMFYLINLMLLSIPVLLIQRKLITQKHLVCLGFIGIHFMTVILFFNQYRYAAAIVPSLFILCVSMLRNLNWRTTSNQYVRLILFAVFFVASIGIGWQVRRQANAEKQVTQELRTLSAKQKFTALMCTWNNGAGLGVGYAVSPKNIYFFPPDITLDDWFSIAAKLETKSGIINPNASLYKKLKPFVVYEQPLELTGMTYFEIDPNKK